MANKKIPDIIIQTAAMIDLPQFLRQQGIDLKEYRTCWEYGKGAEKVTVWKDKRDGHYQWMRQYDRLTGNPIQWLLAFSSSVRSFADAVYQLYDWAGGKPIIKANLDAAAAAARVEEKKKYENFRLPPRNQSFGRCMAYLCQTRKIDPDVVAVFHKAGLVYESTMYHNAVFVGYDTSGVARHAYLRGTLTNEKSRAFRGNQEDSHPGYAFHWVGDSPYLFVFEAPIDALSFICLHPKNWQHHSYTALCGTFTDTLVQFLQDNPYIQKVYLCCDNDEAGRKGNQRCADALDELGVAYEILVPRNNDWNDDLKEVRA